MDDHRTMSWLRTDAHGASVAEDRQRRCPFVTDAVEKVGFSIGGSAGNDLIECLLVCSYGLDPTSLALRSRNRRGP